MKKGGDFRKKKVERKENGGNSIIKFGTSFSSPSVMKTEFLSLFFISLSFECSLGSFVSSLISSSGTSLSLSFVSFSPVSSVSFGFSFYLITISSSSISIDQCDEWR
jgi:hypothetical protein